MNYSTVDCGSPSAPINGAIISQTSTLEGSRIAFKCDDGFSPSLAMDAECQPNGNWQPDPAGVVCTAATTSKINGKLNDMIIM